MQADVVRIPDVPRVVRFSDASVRLADAILELRRAGRDLQPLASVLADQLGQRCANRLLAVIGQLNDIADAGHVAIENAR